MLADNVHYLKKQKRFRWTELQAILPQIQAHTEAAYVEAKPLLDILQTHLPPQDQIALAAQLQTILDVWAEGILRWGAIPKGLWLVDFDSGKGFWCWRRGESDVAFEHGYAEGFAQRRPIVRQDVVPPAPLKPQRQTPAPSLEPK